VVADRETGVYWSTEALIDTPDGTVERGSDELFERSK
jgi:hypothetical protein